MLSLNLIDLVILIKLKSDAYHLLICVIFILKYLFHFNRDSYLVSIDFVFEHNFGTFRIHGHAVIYFLSLTREKKLSVIPYLFQKCL